VKVPVSDKGVLSLGFKGGFYNDSKNLSNAYLGASNTYLNDIAFASNLNQIIPLAGAGVYYNDDKFYAGFSAPDLVVFLKLKTIMPIKAYFKLMKFIIFLQQAIPLI